MLVYVFFVWLVCMRIPVGFPSPASLALGGQGRRACFLFLSISLFLSCTFSAQEAAQVAEPVADGVLESQQEAADGVHD